MASIKIELDKPEEVERRKKKWINSDGMYCVNIEGEWCRRYDCECVMKSKNRCAYWMLKRKYGKLENEPEPVKNHKTMQQVVDSQWPQIRKAVGFMFASEEETIIEMKREAERKAMQRTMTTLQGYMRK